MPVSEALKPGGRYLAANPRLLDFLRALVTNRHSDRRVVVALASESTARLEALSAMVAEGIFTVSVDSVVPPARVSQAHMRVETEQRTGAVVLDLLSDEWS